MQPSVPDLPTLPAAVPVTMPALPARLVLTTSQHFQAVHDPTRVRILGMILHQPMTAKQMAIRLTIPHGTIGHHLQILEDAGLVQVIAKRSVRNMTAKYYARTAHLFDYHIPAEITGTVSLCLDLITQVRDEMAEAVDVPDPTSFTPVIGVRHLRLSAAQVQAFAAQVTALLEEYGQQGPDPHGTVYALCGALYVAPTYLQVAEEPRPATEGQA